MKKIAFFDIDGTMVNVPNGILHPTSETIRVLKTFREQGNYIVVATARTSIPASLSDIDFNGYICSDGHYIELNGEVIMNNIFDEQQIENQIAIYEKHNGNCALGGYNGYWLSNRTCPYLKEHHRLYAGTADLSNIPLVNECKGNIAANSVTAVFGTAEDLYAAKAELPSSWAINAYGDSQDIRMDVHLEGFSKGTACQYVYQYLAIDKKDTYAFGDGENDIEMLQLVGHGIAMGNAANHIKEIADDVTDTVDNDGVAKAFKKYFMI